MSKTLGGEKFGRHWGAWAYTYVNLPYWRRIGIEPQFKFRYIYSRRSIDFRISLEIELLKCIFAFGISREPYRKP